MNEDINLTLTTREDKNKNNLVFLISLGVFSVVFVVSAILVVMSFLISSKLKLAQENETALNNKIAALSVQKARLLSINERLSTIQKIVSSRKKIDVRTNAVLSIIPDGFSIDDFTANDKLLSVYLSSPRLSDFDSLLEEKIPIFAKDKSTGLSRISVNSFSEGEKSYSIALTFNY